MNIYPQTCMPNEDLSVQSGKSLKSTGRNLAQERLIRHSEIKRGDLFQERKKKKRKKK